MSLPPVHERTALSVLGELYASEGMSSPLGRLTGVPALDEILDSGPADGELCLVAGPPGVGKSILCLQWARHLLRAGGVVVHAGIEHSPGSLVARLLQLELRERAAASGMLDDVLDELNARITDVASGVLHVAAAVESHPLLGEAERAVASYGNRLVFLGGPGRRTTIDDVDAAVGGFPGLEVTVIVDYVEKLVPSGASADPVEAVLAELKDLARRRDVAVIAVVTVERGAFTSEELELHHIDRAQTAAYEADQVIGLANAAEAVRARIIKHRSGRAGTSALLGRDFRHARFTSPDPV